MDDHRKNTFRSIVESLEYLLLEEKVEDQIETDEVGKIWVNKSNTFII